MPTPEPLAVARFTHRQVAKPTTRARSQTLYWLAGCLIVLLPEIASAGNGRVRLDGVVQRLDFTVAIGYDASDGEIQDMKQAFQDASDVLFDATDGQFAFGRICFANNSSPGNTADVSIQPGTAKGDPSGIIDGGFGVPGSHLTLYTRHVDLSDFGNAYSIAHEFGHEVWGLFDEYSGSELLGGGFVECAWDYHLPTTNFCLMDDFWNMGGRYDGGEVYTLNEFCVDSNHDANDNDTFQQILNHESCWRTIATHPTRPGVYPQSGLPNPLPGAPPIIETGERLYRPVVSLIYDLSEEVEFEAESILDAAMLFVDLVPDSTTYHIASGGEGNPKCPNPEVHWCSYDLYWPASPYGDEPIATSEQRLQVRNSMAEWTTLHCGWPRCFCARSIPDLLNDAVGYMEPFGSCNKLIVLMTDGNNPDGTPGVCGSPSDDIITDLLDAGVSVISIAVGPDADEGYLRELAEETGGVFYSTEEADLMSIITSVVVLIEESELLSTVAGSTGSSGSSPTGSFDSQVPVDSLTTQVNFLLTWAQPDRRPMLQLNGPSGQVFTSGSTGPDIEVSAGSRFERIQVRRPTLESGFWQIVVLNDSLGPVECELSALSDSRKVTLAVKMHQPSHTTAEPIVIMTGPYFEGRAVAGAEVTGLVRRPDGTSVSLSLLDDGDRDGSGDFQVGDGLYTATFDEFTGGGRYNLRVKVECDTCATAPGESFFPEPPNVISVPDFSRMKVTATYVGGVSAVPDEPSVGYRRGVTVAPNPVRAGRAARIAFSLKAGGKVDARIFDVAGRLVDRIDLGVLGSGDHEFRWGNTKAGTRAIAPGVYFLRIVGPDQMRAGRFVVVE